MYHAEAEEAPASAADSPVAEAEPEPEPEAEAEAEAEPEEEEGNSVSTVTSRKVHSLSSFCEDILPATFGWWELTLLVNACLKMLFVA